MKKYTYLLFDVDNTLLDFDRSEHDAMADALVESLCDFAEAELCKDITAFGRFSPGYADLELSVGYELLSLCSAEKMLGIKVSESGLMIPKKSVNALIAVKDE